MFEGPGILLEAGVGYELGQDSSVVGICFWTYVFFLSDILPRPFKLPLPKHPSSAPQAPSGPPSTKKLGHLANIPTHLAAV